MQRMTRQRAAITDLLGSIADFRSAQEIHDALRERGETVGLATVYRTLQSLADSGRLDVVRLGDENLYRQCAERDHHHHLVCRRCGHAEELIEADLPDWPVHIGERYGFTDVDHTLEVFGLCPRCTKENASSDR